MRNKLITTALFLGGIALTILFTSTDDTTILQNQIDFDQAPPIAKTFTVQKMLEPLETGENLIYRVEYFEDPELPNEIGLFNNGSLYMLLKDDGVYPDLIENDYKYASYMHQDIDEFLETVEVKEDQIALKGGILHFEGRAGNFIPDQDLPNFDVPAFSDHQEVVFEPRILLLGDCETKLLKQNSLFITDLSVVEDPGRTFQMERIDPNASCDTCVIPATGNRWGAWTFGQMIKNMANTPVTNVSSKDFLKNWLKQFLINQSIGSFSQGYDNVIGRFTSGTAPALDNLIGDWISKARQSYDPNYNRFTPTLSNWEVQWDGTNEDSLLVYAPFKLMAIVNRIDLRSNTGYKNTFKSAGETRFVFTLIDPYTGYPPAHGCIGGGTPAPGLQFTESAIDWIGMNVILEYGNPMDNFCDLKAFANEWYQLSDLTLGSAVYRTALQAITDQVVLSGAGGNKNFNQSAINQIRTNEKLSAGVDCFYGNNNSGEWSSASWQLRQFELESGTGGDGKLRSVVLTNTPVSDGFTSSVNPQNSVGVSHSLNGALNIPIPNYDAVALGANPILEWIYGANGNSINRHRVRFDMYNLPEQFLAGKANIHREAATHFDFDWPNSLPPQVITNFSNELNNWNADVPNAIAKEIRHRISLNTCQGCHSGETKTGFTQIFPRGYGQPANYWDAIPSYVEPGDIHIKTPINNGQPVIKGTSIDPRFSNVAGASIGGDDINTEKTFDQSSNSKVFNAVFAEQANNTTHQVVSPFLTGRRYSTINGVVSWQDDFLDDNVEQLQELPSIAPLDIDKTLNDLFFVNDPSNKAINALSNGKGGAFPQQHNTRNGFNDLQRRHTDLCLFFDQPCGVRDIFTTTLDIQFKPMGLGGH